MSPPLTTSELATLSKGNCPACKKRGFVIGPQGGKSINIECANVDCRARFNVAFYSGAAMMGHVLPMGEPWPSDPRPAQDRLR